MRVFFAIDTTSRIKIDTIRKLLSLRYSRRRYEVLALNDGHFPCVRTNFDALFAASRHEAAKIFAHYPDAIRCIVIASGELPNREMPSKTVPVEHASVLERDGAGLRRLLNPKFSETVWVATSPALQPELVETTIDLARFEVT